ncbi:DUF6591 domain-containing protein [Sedimentibacter sp.]|uniref:DUF6591 domain-containing protein n=1 Tax=Sedimentibacter sp. TaxID=1960295 RepID=UPI0028AE1731|nr:DUF6591 domain-containing protein [Sedimentibacter sp.]
MDITACFCNSNINIRNNGYSKRARGKSKKITEKFVENVLGGNVDIDGDEVTIKSEEGDVTFGGNEWPNSAIAKKIPEFKGGKISSAVKSDNYVLIIIEEAGEKDFKAYYEKVKSDFSKDSYDAKFDDSISYTGSNDDGVTIIISYSTSDKSLSIQASQVEKTE